MLSIGIDVGKKTFNACVKAADGRILVELKTENNNAGAQQLLSTIDTPARAVIEATGNHWIRLHDTLEAKGVECLLANPVKACRPAHSRVGEGLLAFHG